jgi:hypothetical protein
MAGVRGSFLVDFFTIIRVYLFRNYTHDEGYKTRNNKIIKKHYIVNIIVI